MKLLRGDGPLLRIGHRGAAAVAPPNSLAGIEAALDAGMDMVELDFLADANGDLALGHALRDLQGAAVSIDDALDLIAKSPAALLADIKRHGYEPALVETLQRHRLVERTVASSAVPSTLRTLGRIEPRLQRSRTYPRDHLGLSGRFPIVVGPASYVLRSAFVLRIGGLLAATGASVATLQHRILSRAVVDRCHAHGAAVFAWTVNDSALVDWLDGLGVDGVITDDPQVFGAPRATLPA